MDTDRKAWRKARLSTLGAASALLAALLLLPIAAKSGHAAGSIQFERGLVVLADYRDLAKADALFVSAQCLRNGHCAAGSIQFERGLVVLADYRDLAKADALFVSAQCLRNGHCGARYDFYRLLYNRTANSFDVLIGNMITKMDETEKDDNDRYFSYTVENAAVQLSLLQSASVKFRAYVTLDSAKLPAFDLNRHIDRAQRVIGGTFVFLVRAFRNGGARDRKNMVGMLDRMKWTRFEALQPVAAISGNANAAL